MTKLTRRDFLKAAGIGASAAALLAACGTTAADTAASTDTGASAETSGTETAEAAGSSEPKSVIYGFAYDASTLDAGMCTDDASGVPIFHCSEGLLRIHGTEVQPGIAESWESSDDAKEWTFHLRESTWSDGTPVTANDFKYGITRLANPENALDRMSDTESIVGVEAWQNGESSGEDLGIEAVDDYTLKITFVNPAFEFDFTGYAYYPVSQTMVESAGETYGAEADTVMYNGPFYVESWVHDSEIVMKKNPNYWDADSVKLDEIHMMANAAGETAVDMMATGTMNACGFTKAMYRDSALEVEGFYSISAFSGCQMLHINSAGKTPETGKWLGNVNFRKALSAATDREALVAAVYTTDIPASKICSDTEMGVEKPFNEEYSYGEWSTTKDEAAAKSYLEAAMAELGCTSVDDIPTFTFLAFDSEGNITALNAIADMWLQTLGIKIELDMETISMMISKAYGSDFDFWKGGNEVNRDSMDFLGEYDSTSGVYIYGYDDPEYNKLYNNVIAQSSWKARKDALAELCAYWTENMMDLEVTWIGNYLVLADSITDVVESSSKFDFTYADMS